MFAFVIMEVINMMWKDREADCCGAIQNYYSSIWMEWLRKHLPLDSGQLLAWPPTVKSRSVPEGGVSVANLTLCSETEICALYRLVLYSVEETNVLATSMRVSEGSAPADTEVTKHMQADVLALYEICE
jgi:hypothetical protein